MFKRFFPLTLLIWITGCTISTDDWVGETRYNDLTQSEELKDDQTLDAQIELKVGQMEVGPGTEGKLYEVDFHYNEAAFEPEVDFRRENGNAKLKVGLSGAGKSLRNMGNNIMRLRLNPSVPVELRTDTGVGESKIDLTSLKVRSLTLQCGVGESEIEMLSPNQSTECDRIEITSGVGALKVVGLGNFSFRNFRFRGGVGGSELDFSGIWNVVGDVEIEVGVGGVEIAIPRGIGAEIRVSKGFFSEFEMPDFSKRGDTYYSDNLERAEKVIHFNIRAGIGGVRVRWL